MNHDSSGQSGVDQTVQWARESLQRRRRELLEKKKNLIASHKDEEARSSSATPIDVNNMLERGRALLAEAEAHSEILGQYASSEKTARMYQYPDPDQQPTEVIPQSDSSHDSDPSTKDFMAKFLQETSHSHSNQLKSTTDSTANLHRAVPNLPVEMPDWDDRGEGNGRIQEGDRTNEEELQDLLKEGEARARLDELIATVRRQGDDLPREEEVLGTPPKRISNFDPSSMRATKRAALRNVKLDEEVAAAEEEARLLTSFKALPLPGGAEVKNNLFASTQSFQLKQIGSVEKLVRRDTKCDKMNDTSSSISGMVGAFDGISVVSSRTSNDNSFSFSGLESEADRQLAKQLRAEKKTKKKQLLDSVNLMILGDMQAASVDDDANSVFSEGYCDIVEDPSKLRQDIARLEAKLKQKKTQRIATLNDIVDIDLNAIFERLVSTETGEDVRHIVERLKDQVYGSVNDFKIMPNVQEIPSEVEEEPKRRSLFRRHEEWAREREQKLFDARLQLEAASMDDITGRPEVSHATRSWRKAKESHDETLKKFAEEEERKYQQKEAKEKASDELKRKEMEELQKQAKSKLTSMRSDVDKEEQMKRLEKLSQPRQIREMPSIIQSKMEMLDEEQNNLHSKSEIFLSKKPKEKTPSMVKRQVKKTIDPVTTDKKPDEFCGKPSFSEMNDKDFAKLVRNISKKAQAKIESENKQAWADP